MKKTVRLLLAILLAAFTSSSCSGSFRDIELTSFSLVSVTPVGMSSLDAVVELGVRNPSMQFTVSRATATLKLDSRPCVRLYADALTVESRSDKTYPAVLHMAAEDGSNILSLLLLFGGGDFSRLTADVSFRATLRSGIGKDFEYKDIPLQNLLPSK